MMIAVLTAFAAGLNPTNSQLKEFRDWLRKLLCERLMRNYWFSEHGREDAESELLAAVITLQLPSKALRSLGAEENAEAAVRGYVAQSLRNYTKRLSAEQARRLPTSDLADEAPHSESMTVYTDQPTESQSGRTRRKHYAEPERPPPIGETRRSIAAWLTVLNTRTGLNIALPATPQNHLRDCAGHGQTIARTEFEFVPWRKEMLTKPPGGKFGIQAWSDYSGLATGTISGDHLKMLGRGFKPSPTALWPGFIEENRLCAADSAAMALYIRILFYPWKPAIIDAKRPQI